LSTPQITLCNGVRWPLLYPAGKRKTAILHRASLSRIDPFCRKPGIPVTPEDDF
jgi:hypothetical protein